MKRSTIKIALALGLLPACCFDEAGESFLSQGSSSSSSEGSSQSSTSVSTTATTSATTTSTTASSESSSDDASSSDGTETFGESATTTYAESSSGSETSTAGVCEFNGQECFDDSECGIAGICYAETMHCFHWCATDDDCPDGTTCFIPGAFGSYCVACAGDDSLCAGGAECNGNDCAEPDHPECVTDGMPCEISDRCVIR